MGEIDTAFRDRPVVARIRRWGARPDILADPSQLDDGRVWATVEDIIPGTPLPPGRLVTACWGELVWTATVDWDQEDPAIIWLTPESAPEPTPSASSEYSADGLTVQLLVALGELLPELADDRTLEAATGMVAAVLAPVLDDFDATVAEYVLEARTVRNVLAQALDRLTRGRETKRITRFLDGPSGRDLLRLARRYRVPPP